ncbi:MAG: DsbA family protein [Deltaproteobacteria bacterium]|nr:DsbA family protein [Deltaproteobacteria bacterium]
MTNPSDVVKAADAAKGGSGGSAGSAAPAVKVDTTPLKGVDLSKLTDDKQKNLFYELVDSLPSPCGKSHSLRTSFNQDNECKRAPFAVRYVVALIEDEANKDQVREEYDFHYKATGEPKTFKLDGVPVAGNPAAKIQLVEFFDYGCPHCRDFKPMMEKVVADHSGQVAVYFKMFPLVNVHPNSMSAAKAALAAQAQGKFKEMHDLLFEKAPAHAWEDVSGYAQTIGLDAAKFKADYDAVEPRVKSEMEEGDAAGVDSTPTVFFNGRAYKGPMHPRYIGMWIDEEAAVNR